MGRSCRSPAETSDSARRRPRTSASSFQVVPSAFRRSGGVVGGDRHRAGHARARSLERRFDGFAICAGEIGGASHADRAPDRTSFRCSARPPDGRARLGSQPVPFPSDVRASDRRDSASVPSPKAAARSGDAVVRTGQDSTWRSIPASATCRTSTARSAPNSGPAPVPTVDKGKIGQR